MTIPRKTLPLALTSVGASVGLLSLAAVLLYPHAERARSTARASQSDPQTSAPDREPAAAPARRTQDEAFVGVLLPEQATDVAAPQPGLVKGVHVALGEMVPAGQLLVSLSVEQARLDFTRAEAELAASRAALARTRIEQAHAVEEAERSAQLAQEQLASSEQLAQARFKLSESRVLTAEAEARVRERGARAAQLAALRDQANVTAAFRGRVAVRYVSPGTLVAAGTPLLRLISDERLVLRFGVPESLSELRAGSEVTLVPDEHRELQFTATVVRVAPEIDAASRMRTVEASPNEVAAIIDRGLVGAIVSVRVREDAVALRAQADTEADQGDEP